MTNPTYTDDMVLAYINAYRGTGVAEMLAYVYADRQRLQEASIKQWLRMQELQEKVKSLQAEVEAYRADAERYRWLRDESQNIPRPVPQVELPYSMYQDDGSCLLFGEELDEAIDAARATPNETKDAKS